MRNLSWKFGIALLTFFVGTILALIWITLDNKPIKVAEVQSRPTKIEIPVPDDKIPEPPSEDEKPAKLNVSKNNSSIRCIKNGGQFCENYLLKKIAKEKSADSQLVRLKNFNSEDETLSPNVKKWIDFMWWEENHFAAELKNNRQKALLLRSHSRGATGLSSSLEDWHIEIENFYSDGFWSFSRNPNLVFWDKDGLLNYYSVIYSDDFLSATSDRDYSKLTFNIERYKINSDGKAVLVSEEQNLKCE
jgi:hypothetical protein